MVSINGTSPQRLNKVEYIGGQYAFNGIMTSDIKPYLYTVKDAIEDHKDEYDEIIDAEFEDLEQEECILHTSFIVELNFHYQFHSDFYDLIEKGLAINAKYKNIYWEMLKTNKHIDDVINKINKKISILEYAEEVQRQYDAEPYNVDWSIIYKNASYIDLIRKSQDVFSFDIDENFYPYPSYYIRHIGVQKIYLPVIEYGPVRVYITNDNGLNVPFFLNKTYNRIILKQFGFSESQTDNILFFINEYKDLIDKKIKSGSVSYEDWLSVFDGQFNLSDVIYNNIIVESKFEIKCGKYSRVLWLQANQNVSHVPRIKVQDRKDKTKSKDFGYIEAHGDFKECYCVDNDLSNDEKKLIRAFVQANKENIRKTFFPKFKDWTFDKFIREIVYVDLNGNPIEKSIQEQTPDVLLSAGKITMDDVVFVDANKTGKNDFTVIKFDDTHLNLYHPEYGICFNRWFKVIFPFDRNDMNIYKFKVLTYDDEIIEVDLNGNLLQKL